MRCYYIYILTTLLNRTLYVGVTNNLERRLLEHLQGKSAFTHKYKINKLIYFEQGQYIQDAIAREKELKGWVRSKKIELIESVNPEWNDLGIELFGNGFRRNR